MAGKLDGKVAIVTGAAGGIGVASAKRLAADGAQLVLADLNEAGIAAAAEQIDGSVALKVDLTDQQSVEAMCQSVISQFGKIDILHNNAAIQSDAQRQRDLDVVNLDVDAWDMAMAVNVRGAMLTTKYVVPHMIAGGGGSIIGPASLGSDLPRLTIVLSNNLPRPASSTAD